jgi:hypothetical protein
VLEGGRDADSSRCCPGARLQLVCRPFAHECALGRPSCKGRDKLQVLARQAWAGQGSSQLSKTSPAAAAAATTTEQLAFGIVVYVHRTSRKIETGWLAACMLVPYIVHSSTVAGELGTFHVHKKLAAGLAVVIVDIMAAQASGCGEAAGNGPAGSPRDGWTWRSGTAASANCAAPGACVVLLAGSLARWLAGTCGLYGLPLRLRAFLRRPARLACQPQVQAAGGQEKSACSRTAARRRADVLWYSRT